MLAVMTCYFQVLKGLFTPLFKIINDIWKKKIKKKIKPLTASVHNIHSALSSTLTS